VNRSVRASLVDADGKQSAQKEYFGWTVSKCGTAKTPGDSGARNAGLGVVDSTVRFQQAAGDG